MADVRCPQCGHDLGADNIICFGCGLLLNGEVLPTPGELTSGKPTPERMEWPRAHFSEEEFLARLREIQETGGLELKDFIQELEQEADRND